MNAIFNLLNPNNTVSVNRHLAHAIGLNEAVVYGALLTKWNWYSERGMLDSGWFYSTVTDLQESTALSERQQKRCVDNLVKAGLIRCELRGMPAKRNFYIVEDVELIKCLITKGERIMNEIKSAAVESYDKKRKSETDKPNEKTQKIKKFLSAAFGATMPCDKKDKPLKNNKKPYNKATLPCSDKSAEQAPTKCQSKLEQNVGASSPETAEQYFIKTKYNNPDIINLSINSDEERTAYKQIVLQNINGAEDDDIEIVEVMLDVICSKQKYVRVNSENYPQNVVKSRFLQITREHIAYVKEAMRNIADNIRNMRAYLITALFNAPTTICNFRKSYSYANSELPSTPSSFDMDEVMAKIIGRYNARTAS